MVLRFYADESGDDHSGIVRIAGYLMTGEQWAALDAEIGRALGSLRWFHMRERDHLKHPHIYNGLLRTITPKTVLHGISVSVNRREYDALVSEPSGKKTLKQWMGGHYAFLVQAAMSLCGVVCREQERLDDWIAYFFEAGHPSEGDANTSVKLFEKEQYHGHVEAAKYASHTFLKKEGPLSRALIPCDILAWHLTNWRRGGNQCAELTELLRTPTRHIDFTAEEIRQTIAKSKLRMATFDKHGRRYGRSNNE
jgi:hypothetical protein